MFLTKRMSSIQMPDGSYVLLNLLTGSIDLLDKELTEIIDNPDEVKRASKEVYNQLLERGYYFENDLAEQNKLREIINTLNDIEIASPPNFVVIPSYNCNLRCSYCYEGELTNKTTIVDFTYIDRMFEAIETLSANWDRNEVLITLMGGEPLLSNNRDVIEYILKKVNHFGLPFNVVTNGTTLEDYIGLLKTYNVQAIQVTLDGPPIVHDKRRINPGGEGTFYKILDGIDATIANNVKVYLRVNVDMMNIEALGELAEIIIKRWGTDSPMLEPYIYLISEGGCLGDNYCIPEDTAVDKIIELTRSTPSTKIFKWRFHGLDFLSSSLHGNGFIPMHRFCSATKNQYVLGAEGKIYKCWFGVGDTRFAIGQYYPSLEINNTEKEKWQKRSIANIEKLKSKNLDC